MHACGWLQRDAALVAKLRLLPGHCQCWPLLPSLPQIGTYTLFQETYHRPTFKHMHIAGPKSGAGAAGVGACMCEC